MTPQISPSRTRQTGRIGGWLLVGLALAVAVGTLVVLRATLKKPVSTATNEKRPVITVAVMPAAYRAVDRTLAVTGTVSAWDELSVGSEANGLRIEAVHVEEGDEVTRGQVLAELNSSILRAQLQALQARYSQAGAAIEKAVQPNRPQDLLALESALRGAEASVDQEQANLVQTRANLENARTNATRYAASLSEGFVTAQEAENRQTELERQRALVQAAEHRVEAARFAAEQARQRLDVARIGGRREDVEIAQATRAEIAAQIQQVQAQIAQTTILAPDDGLIVKRQAHLGDIASAGKTLFTMVRRNRLELKAQMPEVDLDEIRVGQGVSLEYDGRTVVGKVFQVSPTVDPSTRLGVVRVSVPDRSGLRPGMFVRGTIALGSRNVLSVPSVAVLGEAGKYFVFTLEGDVVHRTSVETGARAADRVEIMTGLKPGEKVVVEGAGFLSDGDAVTVKS